MKNYYFLICVNILTGLFIHSVYAGNTDSLYVVLEKTKTDTARVSVLLEISRALEKTDPARSQKALSEAYSLLKTVSFPSAGLSVKATYYANTLRRAGFVFLNKDLPVQAELFFTMDFRFREMLKDTSEWIKSYGNLARIAFNRKDYDTVFHYYNEAIALAVQTRKYDLAGDLFRFKGIAWDNAGKSDSAVSSYVKSSEYYTLAGNKFYVGMVENLIGNQYKFRSEYEKALEYYQRSLSAKEEAGDTAGMAYACIGIANVFINWGYYDKAQENYRKCYDLSEKIDNTKGMSGALVGLANIYQREEKFDSALVFYQKSLLIEQMANNPEGIALAKLNMADVYTKMKNYNQALDLYQEAHNLMEQTDNKIRTNLILYLIGDLYYQQKNYDLAIRYFEKSLKVAREISYNQTILADLQGLANAWSEKKQYEKAFRYLYDHKILNDSLFNEEKMTQLTEMQEKYESEKKEKEILKKDLELSEKEKEAGIQKNIRNILIAGFLVVFVFAILVFRSYRQKKKANRIISDKNALLEQANAEIMAQRDEIEAQRDEIQAQRDTVMNQKDQLEKIHEEQTSSIRYAQRIQNAMLPSLEVLDKSGFEYFLIFRPRDIVSGDFYWMARQDNLLVFAVADCTGHGVPGAFMSMLGIAFLKEIVTKEYITQPDVVLKKLRKEIVRSLKQEGGSQRDGMDIALCTLNLETLELQFAGANNPIYIVGSKQQAAGSESPDCPLPTADCQLPTN